MAQNRLIRKAEVLEKTQVSASTIYKLEREGQFPKHFMISARCAVWYEADIDAWIAQRSAQPAAHCPIPDGPSRKRATGRPRRSVAA